MFLYIHMAKSTYYRGLCLFLYRHRPPLLRCSTSLGPKAFNDSDIDGGSLQQFIVVLFAFQPYSLVPWQRLL